MDIYNSKNAANFADVPHGSKGGPIPRRTPSAIHQASLKLLNFLHKFLSGIGFLIRMARLIAGLCLMIFAWLVAGIGLLVFPKGIISKNYFIVIKPGINSESGEAEHLKKPPRDSLTTYLQSIRN